MSEEAENTTKVDRQWPVTITLKHPVEYGSERIASLLFRRGRLGDLKGLKIDGIPTVDHLVMIASRLSGQFVPVIERLDAEDGAQVLEVALDFFGTCLAGGRTP